MKEFRVKDVSELSAIAKEVVDILKKHNEFDNKARIIGLHGDLGAGKTTFMQILAEELGVNEIVSSPTYVIMKKYKTDHEIFQNLIHIDAYRIEHIDEMKPLRFAEEANKKNTIIGIEWAEKIEPLLPSYTLHMYFDIEVDERVIKIDDKKS